MCITCRFFCRKKTTKAPLVRAHAPIFAHKCAIWKAHSPTCMETLQSTRQTMVRAACMQRGRPRDTPVKVTHAPRFSTKVPLTVATQLYTG